MSTRSGATYYALQILLCSQLAQTPEIALTKGSFIAYMHIYIYIYTFYIYIYICITFNYLFLFIYIYIYMHVYAWRTCKLPLHSDRCGIRSSFGAVLWLGWETGVSREQLQWYYEQGGRVMKGLHMCMFPLPHGQGPPPPLGAQQGLCSGSRKCLVGSA